eukprot:1051181-Alexandrium_andersonii.AAC.1
MACSRRWPRRGTASSSPATAATPTRAWARSSPAPRLRRRSPFTPAPPRTSPRSSTRRAPLCAAS